MSEQTRPAGSWEDRMDEAFSTATPDPTDPSTPDPASAPDPTPLPTEPVAAAVTDPDPAPVPPAPSDAPAHPAVPAAPSDAAPPAVPTPFTFRADGQEITPAGVVKNPDGSITFSADSWRPFQQKHVANREVWQRKEQQYQRTIAESQQVQTARQAQADAILAKITEAAQQGEQAIYDLATGFAAALPKLTAEAEAKFWRDKHERAQQQEAPQRAEQEWHSWRDERESSLHEVAQWATQQPEWTLLKGREDAILKPLMELSEAGRLWSQNPEGQWVIDQPTFRWFMGLQVEAAKQVAAQQQQQAAAALTQRNQAVLQPKVAAPPVPAGAAAPHRVAVDAKGRTPKERYQAWQDGEDDPYAE